MEAIPAPPRRTARAIRHGLGLMLAAGLGLTLAPGPTATWSAPARADSLDQHKKQVDRALSRQQDDLDGSSRRLDRATTALRQAETRLGGARTALATTRTQLAAARRADRAADTRLADQERALTLARAAVDRGVAELTEQRGLTARAVGEQYQRQTALMPFAVLLQSGSFGEFQSRVQLSATLLDASQVEYDRLTGVQRRLRTDQARQTDLEQKLAADRAVAATALRTTRALEQRAADQTAALTGLVRSRRTAQQAASRAVAQDRRDYAVLQQESASVSARIAARVARERAAARRAARSRAATSTGAPTAQTSHHGFVYPVGGPITSPYGIRFHPVLHIRKLHDGTDFAAGCGTPIRAAYSGRVVERYVDPGYGSRLMIDHGRVDGRYATTGYNHATHYVVGVGQWVRQGQLIGYVGQTGFATGCHLHLMAWLDGSMVDPMTWY